MLIYRSVAEWDANSNLHFFACAPEVRRHFSPAESPLMYGVISPPTGEMAEVQKKNPPEEGWRHGEEKKRRKWYSNALPGNSREPAITSPHDISERKCDTPFTSSSDRQFIQHDAVYTQNQDTYRSQRAVYNTQGREPSHFHAFINVTGAIATSPTPDLPSRKLFPPYRKRHDIIDIGFNMKQSKHLSATQRG